jgi:hypothetical protein
MSEGKTISKKVQQLIRNLGAKEENKVLKTFSLLEAEGNEHVLRPVVELYLSSQSDTIKDKAIEFLSDLSDSSATMEMIEIIRDDKFQSIRKEILNAMWQTKLDFSPFLADFVAVACEGTFLETFECLTIIENMEGPFEENHTLESQLYLKEYLETEKGKNEAHDKIISDIAVLIKDFDRAIQE